MVSPMINEFANIKASYWLPTIDGNLQHFSQDNLLKIKGAVLLSGGSYYTYSDLLDTTPGSSDGACLPCTHGDDNTCDAFSRDLYPLGRIFNAGGCASQ